MWTGEESQDVTISDTNPESGSAPFEKHTPEHTAVMTGKETAASTTSNSSKNGYKIPERVPGIMLAGDPIAYKNGDAALPHDRAFSIQIGWRLFKLSGASLNSDAPSYFSAYFEAQVRREEDGGDPPKTLYIDRDPETFSDICRHLQGYYILPRDATHFAKLYADAQFYSLPRLIAQLFDSDIFVNIGGTPMQIPRDAFSGPGNSSNFFTLGFSGFFGSRDDAFPGLETRGLMRPPPLLPQSVPNRDPAILNDLINLSRGYKISVRDQNHRTALLGDCKYYGFKGLMHKIFACKIAYNAERMSTEIVMRIEDLHKSGVSFFSDPHPSDTSSLSGWVHYARPFVDETSYEAIIEIAEQETKLDIRNMRAEFFGDTKARIASLFQTVADKMNLPNNLPLGLMMSSGGASAAPASPANTPLSEDRVKIHIGQDAFIMLDGAEHVLEPPPSYPSSEHEDWPLTPQPQYSSVASTSSASYYQQPPQQQQQLSSTSSASLPPPAKKRKRVGSLEEFGEWIVKKAQWRLRVQPKETTITGSGIGGLGGEGSGRAGRRSGDVGMGMEIVLWAVKMEAYSGQRGRNGGRGWVGEG